MILAVAKAAGDSSVEFDHAVHGLTDTVAGAAGVEVLKP